MLPRIFRNTRIGQQFPQPVETGDCPRNHITRERNHARWTGFAEAGAFIMDFLAAGIEGVQD
jgi:hypothetical protein